MPKLLIVAMLAGLALSSGCQSDDLTPQERSALATLMLKPPPPNPTNKYADNPQAALLGQKFFFDTGFSNITGSAAGSSPVSCASCHNVAQGGADIRFERQTQTSMGISVFGTRNSQTVLNAALINTHAFYWDGRSDTLWSQAIKATKNPQQMNAKDDFVTNVIQSKYLAEYQAVFGTLDPADTKRVFVNYGKAIEAYERLLVDSDSPFDRYMRGNKSAISPSAVRGAKLFVGRASCIQCHSGPALSDGKFYNLGVPQVGQYLENIPNADEGRFEGIPKVLIKDDFNSKGVYSDDRTVPWLDGLAQTPADHGAFRTPTLRNISKTAPYKHTGEFKTLWQVMEFYRQGGGRNRYSGELDSRIRPLNLTDDDLIDLIEFLKTLDGDPLPASLTKDPGAK